jgi:peptidyl-prolyl cis-trans isomerase A (cyclophilin A)
MRTFKKGSMLCFCLLGLAGFSGSVMAQAEQNAPPSEQSAPAATDQVQPSPAPGTEPSPAANPPMTGPKLLIATAMGDITLQLDATRAPKSVANVLRYAREKHYDGTVVYRVVKGFVIQMGSFAAHGKGRGVHPGPVSLEAGNGLHNLRGAVALAHGDDPDSATADFFIDLGDNNALDAAPGTTGYAVFGQVTDGMDVVDRISQVPVGDDGPMKGQAPLDPVLIKKVSIIGGPESAPKSTSKKKR